MYTQTSMATRSIIFKTFVSVIAFLIASPHTIPEARRTSVVAFRRIPGLYFMAAIWRSASRCFDFKVFELHLALKIHPSLGASTALPIQCGFSAFANIFCIHTGFKVYSALYIPEHDVVCFFLIPVRRVNIYMHVNT